MKQVIDLLRQIAEVSEDPALVGNLRSATDKLDRGIVGYSSLESIIERQTRAAAESRDSDDQVPSKP